MATTYAPDKWGVASTIQAPPVIMASSNDLDSPGKVVVFLKASKGNDDPYAVAFREAGFTPHFIPVLHFEYTNSDQLAAALTDSENYSGLVFSSQTAIDSSHHALSTLSPPDWKGRIVSQWKDQPTFVVGKATAQAVSDKLGLSSSGSVSGNAEALSKVIVENYKDADKSMMKPLLFPCSVLRRETLPSAMAQAGIPLQCLTCYNTVAHPDIAENIHSLCQSKTIPDSVWAVYFSPSGVSFAQEHIKSMQRSHQVAAIGPTTAEALESADIQVDATASKPNAESLVQAITDNYKLL